MLAEPMQNQPLIIAPEMEMKPNWPLLAAMRFVLAFIVVLSHTRAYQGFRPTEVADFIGSLGCVMAFFMISGYSISHSINQKPKKFLMRRLWRIWPTYLFSFFVLTLPANMIMLPRTKLWQLIGNGLLLQGTFVRVLEANAGAWSLAVEELLYLFSPIFRRTSTRILLALIAGSSLLYAFSGPLGITRFAGEIAGRSVVCCAWAWLLGFVYYRHAHLNWARNILIFLPVLLLGASNQLAGNLQCTVVLATALLLIYSPEIKPLSAALSRVLTWLGNVSYPLYLCHYPILFLVPLFAITKGNPYTYLAISCVLSVAVYHFIDAPNRGRWQKPFPIPLIFARQRDAKLPAASTAL